MTDFSARPSLHRAHLAVCLALGLTVAGCPSSTPLDASTAAADAARVDANRGATDAGPPDARPDAHYGLMDAPTPEDAPRPPGRFDCEGGYCEEGEVCFVFVGSARADAAVGPDAGPSDDASVQDAGRAHAPECRPVPAECPPLADCFGSCDVWRGCFHAPCSDVLISDFGRRFQCAT